AGHVAGLFRSIHTLKGMAGTMGYANLAALAHRAENLLDGLRGGKLVPGPDLLELLFRTIDALEEGVEEAAQGRDAQLELGRIADELDRAATGESDTEAMRTTAAHRISDLAAAPAGEGLQVLVRLKAGTLMPGVRALLALKRAETLGTVSGVRPPINTFEAEGFDGQFVFRLATRKNAAEIESALRGAGDVEFVQVGEAAEKAAAAGAPAPGTAAKEKVSRAAADRGTHIRVDLKRLDALMNQVGELMVAKGRLQELVAREHPELEALASRIGRLTADMQSEIIAARMTPVWQTFDRFPRLVRDLARQLGKQVRFDVEGEGIELDRVILEEIGDPILHLIRNALDHGIEPAAERKKAGKPAEGRLHLQAAQERQSVVIRVSDDGKGLDRTAILAKAKREGLVEEDVERLDDDALLRVIARAGFSTAKQVSVVSGRGVGIDVVVSKVRQLGGAVEIRTTEGKGTTWVLRLPMTLAVVRVLLARVGGERYALPLASVAETIEVSPQSAGVLQGADALVLRDEVIPTRDLRRVLEIRTEVPSPPRRPGIILQVGDRRAALLADALVGQQEIVVEPFEAPRGMLPLFSGAAILGDGAPALILDAATLV
ncbi:MAG TPA: chemotaxis protein CheA, partial [Gemmatimonadales bacterium]|nr:chemotaxis protein CheA [Gemmatimonadales bacterium]